MVRGKYHGKGNATKQKPFRRQPRPGLQYQDPVQLPAQHVPVRSRESRKPVLEPREQKLTGITPNLPLTYVTSLQKGQNLERCNRSVASSRLKIDFLTITEPPKFAGRLSKISSELESSNPRPRNPRHGCGLQARTHGSPRPTQGQSTFALFVNGVKEDRGRNFGTLTKGGLDKCNPRFRPVCK